MRALVLNEINHPLRLEHELVPLESKEEVVVALHAAALNHRDVYISQGLYANIQLPTILGSDGAGSYRGEKVVICPSLNWGSNSNVQARDYHILGMPTKGTFAEFVRVPRANLHPMPEHLGWEEAAALPLAGLTAWRALFSRCQLQAGEKMLITGIGGGVAIMALQLAHALGAEVWVSSSSDAKIQKAQELGAKGGIKYTLDRWDKLLREKAGEFDVILDSAGGPGFSALLNLCKPGARIAVYGGSAGKIEGLSPQLLFWKQISLFGTSMGTNHEFGNMLHFVEKHRIVPVIDQVFELEAGNDAFQRMAEGKQFGKIVLKL